MELAKAAAAINGRDKVVPRDIIAIAFLPGAYAIKLRILEFIAELEISVVTKFTETFATASGQLNVAG